MTITFVSNFINHHQAPLSTALFRMPETDFVFVQTEPMTKERLLNGWALDEAMFSYVHFFDKEREFCTKRILESDIVIFGWHKLPAGLEEERLSSGKIALRISERIYKEGRWKAVSPRGLKEKYHTHIRYNRYPVYMLCADAYAAGDFAGIGAYRGKLFRWGYFPETRHLAQGMSEDCVDGDSGEEIRLCWAGRMIGWKHPEYAIRLADTLASRRIPFTLQMAGDGPLREELEADMRVLGLQKQVIFHKTLRPFEVRHLMEQSNVFLFTSSFLEGWGAVVNEAMNSVCALVASAEAGSVPCLITDGEEGLIYHNGSYEEFEKQALRLVQNRELRRRLSRAAYERIVKLWNEEEAARRLRVFCEGLLKGEVTAFPDDGPLSRAPVLKGAGFLRTRQEGFGQDHV